MPVISVFFGIVIRMFYREHGVLTSTQSIKASKRHLRSTVSCWQVLSDLGRHANLSASGQWRIAPSSTPTGIGLRPVNHLRGLPLWNRMGQGGL